MDQFVGKIAVVTGPSSGSGEAIAEMLAENGLIVVGLARRLDKLEELAKRVNARYPGKVHVLKCDLTKVSEIRSSFQWIFDNLGPVDVLINNAGVMERTTLLECTEEQIDNSYAVNVKAPIICSQIVTKKLIELSRPGNIINMNSVLGKIIPQMNPNLYLLYSSTKWSLGVISEGWRREMIALNAHIKVTNLCPAYVRTPLTDGLELPEKFRDKTLRPNDVARACIFSLKAASTTLISDYSFTTVGCPF